jgi:hypothetical protein
MLFNKLNFKLKVQTHYSNAYIEIFLMASNHNIMFGDMYYIKLQKYYYDSRLDRCELTKCTSGYGGHITIHDQFQRSGCVSITNYVSMNVNFKLWIT